jgi:hypothetical protein
MNKLILKTLRVGDKTQAKELTKVLFFGNL